MELHRGFILFFLIYGLVAGEDVDFGNCELNPGYLVDCPITLNVDCEKSNTGTISSPYYPYPMQDNDLWGKYKLIIKSCPNSIITLTLSEDQFDLGPQSNSFTVGNGEDVTGQIISPKLNGGKPPFPNGDTTLTYTSSSNSLWMNADVSSGRAKFRITYSVTALKDETFIHEDPSGWLNMTNTYNASYPLERIIERHLIKIPEADAYQDIVLTVEMLEISGLYGDYIQIGPGDLNSIDVRKTVLLSWQVNSGYQFLINGPVAHLIFSVNGPLRGFPADENAKGFAIRYELIDKNLTTPAPPTTPVPTEPTPLPLLPDILDTEVVFYSFISNSSAQERMVDILNKYIDSSGIFKDGELYPPLSTNSVSFKVMQYCYHGWNVDLDTCGQIQLMVLGFYQKPNESWQLAFTNEIVKEAVREYGLKFDKTPDDLRVTLPDDLMDIYWLTVGIASGVVVFIVLGLVVFWFVKSRKEEKKQKKYLGLPVDRLSVGAMGDSFKSSPPRATSSRIELAGSSMGINNPNFVIEDEEDYYATRNVTVYDPDRGRPTSVNNYGSRPTSFVKEEPVPIQQTRTTTFNAGPKSPSPKSPSPKSLSPKSSHTGQYFNLPTSNPIEATTSEVATVKPSSTLYPPKRGILKSNSTSPVTKEFQSSILTAMDDMEDVVLYDMGVPSAGNSNPVRIPSRRYSTSSSDTTISQISNDHAPVDRQKSARNPKVSYAVTLDDDVVGETHL